MGRAEVQRQISGARSEAQARAALAALRAYHERAGFDERLALQAERLAMMTGGGGFVPEPAPKASLARNEAWRSQPRVPRGKHGGRWAEGRRAFYERQAHEALASPWYAQTGARSTPFPDRAQGVVLGADGAAFYENPGAVPEIPRGAGAAVRGYYDPRVHPNVPGGLKLYDRTRTRPDAALLRRVRGVFPDRRAFQLNGSSYDIQGRPMAEHRIFTLGERDPYTGRVYRGQDVRTFRYREGIAQLVRDLRRYDPNQPRWPAGTPGGKGGQWRDEGPGVSLPGLLSPSGPEVPAKPAGPTKTVYRGISVASAGDEPDIFMDRLGLSWTSDPAVARDFAFGDTWGRIDKYPAILEADVAENQILYDHEKLLTTGDLRDIARMYNAEKGQPDKWGYDRNDPEFWAFVEMMEPGKRYDPEAEQSAYGYEQKEVTLGDGATIKLRSLRVFDPDTREPIREYKFNTEVQANSYSPLSTRSVMGSGPQSGGIHAARVGKLKTAWLDDETGVVTWDTPKDPGKPNAAQRDMLMRAYPEARMGRYAVNPVGPNGKEWQYFRLENGEILGREPRRPEGEPAPPPPPPPPEDIRPTPVPGRLNKLFLAEGDGPWFWVDPGLDHGGLLEFDPEIARAEREGRILAPGFFDAASGDVFLFGDTEVMPPRVAQAAQRIPGAGRVRWNDFEGSEDLDRRFKAPQLPAERNSYGTIPTPRYPADEDEAFDIGLEMWHGPPGTPEEVAALQRHSGPDGYAPVNGWLRGDGTVPTPEIAEQIRLLDSAMEKSATSQEIWVTRATGHSMFGNTRLSDLPGKTFTEPAYMSTTFGPDPGAGFEDKNVILRLRVPAGTPAVFQDQSTPGVNVGEAEVLLARGAKIEVRGARQLPDGKWEVFGDVTAPVAQPGPDGGRAVDEIRGRAIYDRPIPREGVRRERFLLSPLGDRFWKAPDTPDLAPPDEVQHTDVADRVYARHGGSLGETIDIHWRRGEFAFGMVYHDPGSDSENRLYGPRTVALQPPVSDAMIERARELYPGYRVVNFTTLEELAPGAPERRGPLTEARDITIEEPNERYQTIPGQGTVLLEKRKFKVSQGPVRGAPRRREFYYFPDRPDEVITFEPGEQFGNTPKYKQRAIMEALRHPGEEDDYYHSIPTWVSGYYRPKDETVFVYDPKVHEMGKDGPSPELVEQVRTAFPEARYVGYRGNVDYTWDLETGEAQHEKGAAEYREAMQREHARLAALRQADPPEFYDDYREAEAWLRERYPGLEIDFSSIDPQHLTEIVQSFNAVGRDYPGPASRIRYLGSDMSRSLGSYTPESNVYAFVTFGGSDMVLNPRYFGDADYLQRKLHHDARTVWHPKGAPTSARAVIAHEFGHVVDSYYGSMGAYGLSTSPTAVEKANGWRSFKSRLAREISANSRYGETKTDEHFAEMFSVIREGNARHRLPNETSWAREVHEWTAAPEALGRVRRAYEDLRRYDPDQPRYPAGSRLGGRWREIIGAAGRALGLRAGRLPNNPDAASNTIARHNLQQKGGATGRRGQNPRWPEQRRRAVREYGTAAWRENAPPGTLRTEDPEEALDALAAGKRVELRQPKQISTLLDRLAARVREAQARGEDAPDIDLCNVSVRGTNLFCADSKGIPRIKMPQLKGVPRPGSPADKLPKDAKGKVDLAPAFIEHLRGRGVAVGADRELAANLRASQGELVGANVAGIANRMQSGDFGRDTPIFISRDDYIVDGHHRWAAIVGIDYADNEATLTMPVHRVDLPILDLLEAANLYVTGMGIPPKGFTVQPGVIKNLAAVIGRAHADLRRGDSWRTQPRVPRGAGRESGRWTDTPWAIAERRTIKSAELDEETGTVTWDSAADPGKPNAGQREMIRRHYPEARELRYGVNPVGPNAREWQYADLKDGRPLRREPRNRDAAPPGNPAPAPRPAPVPPPRAPKPAPAPGERPRPLRPRGGVRVGMLVTPAKRDKPLKAMERTLAAIDALHRIDGEDIRPVRYGPLNGYDVTTDDGLYRSAGRQPKSIQVRPLIGDKHLTAAHEVGHWIDHQMFDDLGSFQRFQGYGQAVWGSSYDRRLAGWRGAAFRSPTYEKHHAARDNSRLSDRKRAYAEYLATPHETFARSYSQWVLLRSPDPEIRKEYERISKTRRWREAGQWPPDEFLPIAREFDKLFGVRYAGGEEAA